MSVSATDSNPIVALYRRQMTDFGQQKQRLARRADQVSYARGATFLAAGACLLAGWFGESGNSVWFAAGGLLATVFFSLVCVHGRVLAESERFGQLSRINRRAGARMLRKWQQIPLRATETLFEDEALASDLDLFGEASLFHLVCAANTPVGIDTLKDWFLHPTDSATVVERQQAVAELAPALDTRQALQCRGLKLAAHKTNPAQFLQWAEAEPWLAQRSWLKWASRLLPVLMLVFILLGTIGLLPLSMCVVPLMINIVLGLVYRRHMHAIFGFISTRHGEVGHYTDLLQLISETQVTSTRLVQLKQQTDGYGVEAWREIQRLGRSADLANLRFSDMSHFLVQSFSSWDFHVLALLERWQRRNGRDVRQWFELLGEWEALESLATLVHDNPTWVFPLIDHQPKPEGTISARALGHPLIPDDRCVVNDVTIGPPGTFLMVTGSNMSGKSTLLRAIGDNVVLAQAGGPVCAVHFSMPPVLLATSMRVHDSLADGVSFYMAELRRLKQIVDSVRSQPADADRIVLYLLDEILQGTNTAERQIAVRRVLSHLLAQGAIGAVSTHDLQLAAAPPLSNASHAVHFRETIHNESGRHEMTFDYQLREGLATTSNALKLLEMVGLEA
jgi:DNA mismatch repair ATPase MutS